MAVQNTLVIDCSGGKVTASSSDCHPDLYSLLKKKPKALGSTAAGAVHAILTFDPPTGKYAVDLGNCQLAAWNIDPLYPDYDYRQDEDLVGDSISILDRVDNSPSLCVKQEAFEIVKRTAKVGMSPKHYRWLPVNVVLDLMTCSGNLHVKPGIAIHASIAAGAIYLGYPRLYAASLEMVSRNLRYFEAAESVIDAMLLALNPPTEYREQEMGEGARDLLENGLRYLIRWLENWPAALGKGLERIVAHFDKDLVDLELLKILSEPYSRTVALLDGTTAVSDSQTPRTREYAFTEFLNSELPDDKARARQYDKPVRPDFRVEFYLENVEGRPLDRSKPPIDVNGGLVFTFDPHMLRIYEMQGLESKHSKIQFPSSEADQVIASLAFTHHHAWLYPDSQVTRLETNDVPPLRPIEITWKEGSTTYLDRALVLKSYEEINDPLYYARMDIVTGVARLLGKNLSPAVENPGHGESHGSDEQRPQGDENMHSENERRIALDGDQDMEQDSNPDSKRSDQLAGLLNILEYHDLVTNEPVIRIDINSLSPKAMLHLIDYLEMAQVIDDIGDTENTTIVFDEKLRLFAAKYQNPELQDYMEKRMRRNMLQAILSKNFVALMQTILEGPHTKAFVEDLACLIAAVPGVNNQVDRLLAKCPWLARMVMLKMVTPSEKRIKIWDHV